MGRRPRVLLIFMVEARLGRPESGQWGLAATHGHGHGPVRRGGGIRRRGKERLRCGERMRGGVLCNSSDI